MKIASWSLTFLFTVGLLFALIQLPPSGEISSILTGHVSTRYIHQAGQETGIRSPEEAVLADYRGFDLMGVGILFSAVGSALLLCFTGLSAPWARLPLWFLFIGPLVGLALGLYPFLFGSNFLDHEALARVFPSSQARLEGAVILAVSVLLSLGGLLTLAAQWVLASEAPDGK